VPPIGGAKTKTSFVLESGGTSPPVESEVETLGDLLSRVPNRYVCEECGGLTRASDSRKGPRRVYVDHTAYCETGIRHRIIATKNRRIPDVKAVA